MGQRYAYRGIAADRRRVRGVVPHRRDHRRRRRRRTHIIGAGVKIIGDSHGPVRIGNDVQILENTVLHLLPDNELVIDDGTVIGPGAMIHGCHIGAGSVVEPGAIVCDGSIVGERLRRAGGRGRQATLHACADHRDRRVPGDRGRADRAGRCRRPGPCNRTTCHTAP